MKGRTMLRIAVLCMLLAALVLTAGCFTYDPVHNQRHIYMMKEDLKIIHEDIDFFLGLDSPSHTSRSLY